MELAVVKVEANVEVLMSVRSVLTYAGSFGLPRASCFKILENIDVQTYARSAHSFWSFNPFNIIQGLGCVSRSPIKHMTSNHWIA